MLLDTTFPPDPRVENEAMSLIEAGHEVHLFCLHYGTQASEENYKGIRITRKRSYRFEYKMSALVYTVPFYSYRMRKKILDFVRDNGIEALHIHDIQIAEAAFMANKTFQLPVLLDLHENRPEIMKFYPHLSSFPGNLLIRPSVWKRKEEQFVKNANKVVVVTEEAKKELLSRCEIRSNDIITVPNTVRTSFYKNVSFDNAILEKYKTKKVLLYIGDTGLRRGLQTVIAALPELVKTIADLKVVIVGTSSSDQTLKKQVAALNMDTYVDFEGWQEMSLFPSYIKASAVCLSPLHRNQHHDTTYANKLFQYMSFQKPLLVSDATAQKNLVEKVGAGLVHREQDPKDFAEKLLELFNSQELSSQMGVKGKAFVENEFSWEQTSKNLVHLYDNLSA